MNNTHMWFSASWYHFESALVERLELVGLHRSLVLMEMSERILCAIVVGIVVCVNGLRLKASNCIKLLDSRCAQPCQCSEHSALDLGDFCVFHSVDEGVLCLGGVILELLCGILLTEGRNLVEIHLEVMCHLLGKLILRSFAHRRGGCNEAQNN